MKQRKQYKIAVFGSASENLENRIYKIAEQVGEEVVRAGHILITGAATGISIFAARGAKKAHGQVIGISPTSNNLEKKFYNVDFRDVDFIIHTGAGYKGRNVISVKTCDAMIVINGKFGTLSEVSIGEGEQKPIVAIKNTGGCADIINGIFRKIKPEYKYFSIVNNAKKSVETAINMIDSKFK